jgi:hypothetical protein
MPFKVGFQDGTYELLRNFATLLLAWIALKRRIKYAITVDVAETLSYELQFSFRADVVFVCTSCPICLF